MKMTILPLLTFILFSGCESFSFKRSELNAPTSLTLTYPLSTSHWARDPVIKVTGVAAGEMVKLYTDSNCSSEIASQVASSSEIDINISKIPFGSHHLYARRINSSEQSDCSQATITYNRECPDDNWVPVEPTDGISDDFCVMQFEARDNGSGEPISTPSGLPWRNVSHSASITYCAALGGQYGLINNDEWMIMALQVEDNLLNWNSGYLPSGNSDPASSLLETTDESDPWNGTGFTAVTGWHQRRTFHLSNGSVVWDLAGNLFEWVDWTVDFADKAYAAADGGPVVSVRSLHLIDSNIDSGIMEKSKWMPAGHPYPLSSRVGGYFGDNNSEPNDRAVARGGSYAMANGSEYSGVFATAIVRRENEPRTNVGFRCVFRP